MTAQPHRVDMLAETEADHARGTVDGGVTLLMYGDYECPYTRAAYRNVQRLERRLPATVRFVFRHFPLTEIHPHAQSAAEAAEAASSQGRFWDLHDLMFKRQQALEPTDLRTYAGEVASGSGPSTASWPSSRTPRESSATAPADSPPGSRVLRPCSSTSGSTGAPTTRGSSPP